MVFTLINANMADQLDSRLSELIYTLESKDVELRHIMLKNITSIKACEEVHSIMESSDFVVYVTPLDSEVSRKRLEMFLSNYKLDNHPATFLILDSESLLSVETVTDYLEEFEVFINNHHSKIVDVQYFKDAIEIFSSI